LRIWGRWRLVMEESWWGQPPKAAHYVTRARELRSPRSAGKLTPMIYESVRWKYVLRR
jgi:hypothetical protein